MLALSLARRKSLGEQEGDEAARLFACDIERGGYLGDSESFFHACESSTIDVKGELPMTKYSSSVWPALATPAPVNNGSIGPAQPANAVQPNHVPPAATVSATNWTPAAPPTSDTEYTNPTETQEEINEQFGIVDMNAVAASAVDEDDDTPPVPIPQI